ncbi:MAG: transposase [Janthinobacterium lividum]
MPTFPREFQTVIVPYAHLFCRRVFAHVRVLLLGALLAPGKRTVTSVLRIVGLGQQPAWHKYHRVLSRARWSARAASRVLLTQLVAAFLPAGPLVFGLDETLERRWGPRIAARGIPTFSDALAAVRRYLWAETSFDNSPTDTILLKIPCHQLRIWQEALAWAA